jgi:hypothetical protein
MANKTVVLAMLVSRHRHAQAWRARTAASCRFGGVLPTVIGRRELPSRTGRRRPPGRPTARTRRWPWRWLPAGTGIMRRGGYLLQGYQHDDYVKEQARDRQDRHGYGLPHRDHDRPHAGIKRGHHRDHPAWPQARPHGRWPGTPRRLGGSLPGGKVSGEGGQICEGPRPERLAHPQVELVPVQPSLHERGLEHVDHLLALGVRRAQAAKVARARCYLVSRPSHPGHLPTSTMCKA